MNFEIKAGINLFHCDCMDLMKETPDKFYDLCIVDPPYGIGRDYQTSTICKNPKHNRKGFDKKGWDNEAPDEYYFNELFRISKNQIIWGANYFPEFLFGSMGWVVWDKGQELSMSDAELAFTSFNRALRIVKINRGELARDGSIHPTQKPIKLYKWLLKNYASPNFKIIDTHLGSGSSAIAAYDFDISEFVGCEIDKEYYEAAVKRFETHKMQLKLMI